MNQSILNFADINKTMLPIVGGKGANLGELTKIGGLNVPGGFCITTDVYKAAAQSCGISSLISEITADNTSEISSEIRGRIENAQLPQSVVDEIKVSENTAYAVRSSATSEDLPTASFAGQQDTYLNIIGKDNIINAIKKCLASLFTERAVVYRNQNNFPHDKVSLSVVIQEMVQSEMSGIMFTADPVSGNRKVISIDASFGLGEALVSGLVNSDNYKIYNGRIIAKKVENKEISIVSDKSGGTAVKSINNKNQVLTDEQILELSEIGKKIEAHFDSPQDIEWAFSDGKFYIVQSRPITTLYPTIENKDNKNHIYTCMAHTQMMTDAMKPLGLAFFPLFISGFFMPSAGGRLFLDSSPDLKSKIGRFIWSKAMGVADPYYPSIIDELNKRKDFMKNLAGGKKALSINSYISPLFPFEMFRILIKKDKESANKLSTRSEKYIQNLDKEYSKYVGAEVVDKAEITLKSLQKVMYDYKIMGTIYAGLMAQSWINRKCKKWCGIEKAADVLIQSVDNNVTSNMGLDLLDVADVVREYPEIMKYFESPNNNTFFEDLEKLSGGREVASAIKNYLNKYGVRCTGEIDITRPRFYEQPTDLVPLIMNNISSHEPNYRKTSTDKKLREVEELKSKIISKLSKHRTKKMLERIDLMRPLIGFREFPKFSMIQCYWVIKKAWMREADKLVEKGILENREDVYYLMIDEFRDLIEKGKVDYKIINQRKEEFKAYEKLSPPRVITSEGECFFGTLNVEIPEGALGGLPVSQGVIEGTARVVFKMEDAKMQDGEILVTRFTDPSWTPVFVSISGLVTEVGGQMTHGSVIAREYGIPAVVSVNDATTKIKTGDKIKVDGTLGYVQILK
ncbi:MAG: phosphoenolpyruvate synthase [Bacillota bacterium]|nr:phosphoenolpyruvate synthase [Bacillota bacterium]